MKNLIFNKKLLSVILSFSLVLTSISSLCARNHYLAPPGYDLYGYSQTIIISRINKILGGNAIKDEHSRNRAADLWKLSELILHVYDNAHLIKIRAEIKQLSKSYTCIGPRLDALFLDELLSALIEKRSDFYERFIKRAREAIEIISAQNAVDRLANGTLREGDGVILDSGFKNLKQCLKMAQLRNPDNRERYIITLPSDIALFSIEPRYFVMAPKHGSFTWQQTPVLYEYSLSCKFKGITLEDPYEPYWKGDILQVDDILNSWRNWLRDYQDRQTIDIKETLRLLGIIEGRELSPLDDSILLLSNPSSHASSVPHLIPELFFWHTHPAAGRRQDCGSSDGDNIYAIAKSFWRKRFVAALNERLFERKLPLISSLASLESTAQQSKASRKTAGDEDFIEIYAVDKDKARHIICGVGHYLCYQKDIVELLCSNADIITGEAVRYKRKFIYTIIYEIINKIDNFLAGSPPNQEAHEQEMLRKGRRVLSVDIYYTKVPAAITEFVNPHLITLLFVISMIFSPFNKLYTTLIALGALCINYGYHAVLKSSFTIDMEFRSLVWATKLNFLNNILKIDSVEILSIVGKIHAWDTAVYLLSDSVRNKAWQKCLNNPGLVKTIARKLDIVKSMEIFQLKLEVNKIKYEKIGTIADLPYPRELIVAIQGNTVSQLDKSH